MSSLPRRFGVLVPVKPPAFAKSRLAPLGDEVRRALAGAFAMDTVAAVLRSPVVARVLVVTDDHVVAGRFTSLGAEVVPDGVSDDLNGSLAQGAAELRRRDPALLPAVVCADLPALRPAELTDVLDACPEEGAAFLADRKASGTSVLVAATHAELRPSFGPRSRQRHLDLGAVEITLGGVPTVRHDVDDADDLRGALALGVGRWTAEVVQRAGLAIPTL
jgi:2-phospho-L-lactate guanylyltransferase